MRAGQRRELILDEAMRMFGDHAYVGTTTAAIARASGVSQPYVVGMFGTKEKLLIEVLYRAIDALLAAFRAALAEESEIPVARRIGLAYVGLAAHRGLLLSLMHAFVLGGDPGVGPVAREGFLCVYRFLREEAGFTVEESQNLLSAGMLVNTMIGLQMADDVDCDPSARELLTAVFPEKLDLLRSLTASATVDSASHSASHSVGHSADHTADDTAGEAGA
jgi:TetR/AcrR family transcriptional regulator